MLSYFISLPSIIVLSLLCSLLNTLILEQTAELRVRVREAEMEAKEAVAASQESAARVEELQHALDASEALVASAVNEDGDETVVQEISRLKKVLREERAQHEEMIMASRFVVCVYLCCCT